MKRITCIILIFTISIINGQDYGNNDNTLLYSNSDFNFNYATFKKHDTKIEGNIYLFENFSNPTILISKSGKKFKLDNINYNLIDKKFEMKISKDSIFSINNNFIDYVDINKKMFKKLNANNNEVFYEILYNGEKKSLIKDYQLRIVKGSFDPLNGNQQPDKYLKTSKYFILYNDGSKTKVDLKKKDVLNLFKGKSDLIKKYVKKNNLSYKKENDVINIFKHINSFNK